MRTTKLDKNGNIPAGKTCLLVATCNQKTSECPKRGQVKEKPHNCGWLRLYQISASKRKETPAIAFETPIAPTLPSLADAVSAKQADRYKPEVWATF